MAFISSTLAPKVYDWQMPPVETPGEFRKGWLDELVQNGDRFLQAQPGIRNSVDDIRLLIGEDQDNQLKSNTLQSDIRTFVETITDLRQIATMGSRAEQTKKIVSVYNDVFKYTFWDSEFVFKSRKALQWAMLGRGYLWTKFSRDRYGWGKGRNVFDPLGPFEVLPEQIGSDNDIQSCYIATIIRAMPVAEAHARFPDFQQWLKPISRYDWTKYNTLGGIRLDFWDRARFGETKDWDNRYCEIRYHVCRDLRMNETGKTLQMGVKGSSWGYEVPTYGDLMTWTNPFNMLPESRKATEEDCRVYPQLRLAISSPSVPVPMYDDTAFDMHGEIPIAQYDVNDWAWSAMGYSAIRPVADLEKHRRARLSEIDEVLAVRKDPPTGYDMSTGVSRTQMEKLDLLRAQGVRIGLKGDPKKSVVSVLPDSINVDGEDWKGQEWLDNRIAKTLGLTDIASMKDLKLNVSDQSFDKMIENLGPMAKGIAVNMWRAHGKIANMLKYNIPQYIPVAELISMVGPEGVGIETFDNDPNSLIPGRLPGEPEDQPSRYTKWQRAKWVVEKMNVVSTPAQLLNITQMQERMTYMLLFQKQAPLPMEVYMEKFGVQGYEALKDQWRAEQQNDALWKLEVAKTVQEKQKELGLEPPPDQGPGQGKGGGRPNSGKKPVHAELKGSQSGNVRAVNSTS
jgi:hypothetical protein